MKNEIFFKRFSNLILSWFGLTLADKIFLPLPKQSNEIKISETPNIDSDKNKELKFNNLGMDVLPFPFLNDPPTTEPEREVDFYIEKANVPMLLKYSQAGYEFNDRQLFNLFLGYSIGIDLMHSHKEFKKHLLKNYSTQLSDLMQTCLNWSHTTAVPKKEEFLKVMKQNIDLKDFAQQKEKSYHVLQHLSAYCPEVYEKSLAQYHTSLKNLKETHEFLETLTYATGIEYGDKGYNNLSEFTSLQYYINHTVSAFEGMHELVQKKSLRNPQNLQEFIKESKSIHSPKIKSSGEVSLQNLNDVPQGTKIEKSLPPQAQKSLKAIEAMINPEALKSEETLQKWFSLHQFTQEEKNSFKDLLLKELPQVLKNYEALHTDNIENEAHEEVQQLLVQSLQQIQGLLEKNISAHNERKKQKHVSNLKISHRYLHNKAS